MRTWLLPLMRNKIQNTELSYFIDKLLPLANKLLEKSLEKNKDQVTVEGKQLKVSLKIGC